MWRTRRQVVKTLTIISNNPVFISIGKSERKRKKLNGLGANMKVILRRNFQKYDWSVEVDYSQFCAGMTRVCIRDGEFLA